MPDFASDCASATIAPASFAPASFAPPGRYIGIGPFVVLLRSEVPQADRAIANLYGDFPTWPADAEIFADFHVALERPRGLRRWLRPQVRFTYDRERSFTPLKLGHALLMFEGGLNWTIAENANFFLVLHAASVERNGRTAVMPAPSGSGKSTLCAALVSRGWRLISDETTLISLVDGTISAVARPISLKNEAIAAVARFVPDGVLSERYPGTEKGTVAFLKPPVESVRRVGEPAVPAWVILPKYERRARSAFTERGKADTFMTITESAYNLSLFGREGFETLANLVDRCACYDFVFSDLAAAVDSFDALAAGA
jgi:HprK-related kinase A